MPHSTRAGLRGESRILRDNGEIVTLLISSEDKNSRTSTPLDLVQANTSVDLSTCIKKKIYAHVRWKETDALKFEEGGRSITREAEIETTVSWSPYLVKTLAVILDDGSVLRKKSDKISETDSIYTMTVEGYANVPQ